MGFSLSDLDPTKVVKKVVKEAERTAKRVEAEAKRTVENIEKAVKKAGDDVTDEIEHVTGIDIKPIVKAIAGPAHILVKVAEGHNLSEATTDWVVNQVDGAGEIGGIFGDDVEKIARTIVSYANVPTLILVNMAGDTVEIVEGDQSLEDIVGSPLKSLIKQAHALYDKHAVSLPVELKMVLSQVVDRDILNRARVVIDRTPDNVAGLANSLNHNSSGSLHAVTLDDIIVFSGRPSSDLGGYLHWVHELAHVKQYKEWGVLEFAARYTRDHAEIEAEAKAAEIAAKPVLETLIRDFT